VVGWRRSLANLFRRAIPHSSLRSMLPPAAAGSVAQGLIENAALDFEPPKYEGKVLLLLAKERDPHFNFLSGWKSVVPNLHAFYVPGRHRELITSSNVREVANLIQSTLKEDSEGEDNSWRASA
jgi:thioesterase domain-containing protein